MGFIKESQELIVKMIEGKIKVDQRLTNETLEEFIKCIRAVYSSLVIDGDTKTIILKFIDTYIKKDIDTIINISIDTDNVNNSVPSYSKFNNQDDNDIYTEYVNIYNEELKLKTKTDVIDFIKKSIKELEEEYIDTELSKELYDALMQYWHEKMIFYNL